MAHVSQMPCDGDGICMLCKEKPPEEEKLSCKTCSTPWHANCLAVRPETLESTLQWECPDCGMPADGDGGDSLPPSGKCGVTGRDDVSGQLISAIRDIEADASLTELEKAKKRQELLSGRAESWDGDGDSSEKKGKGEGKGKEKVDDGNDVLKVVETVFNCSFCMQLPERPVTTPCGHNFCLKCFQKWISQGKNTCAKCRCTIPPQMARQPRINSLLVAAIRTAKMSKSNDSIDPDKIRYYVHNQNRPDKAYTTERAKKTGKANAASGKIFVTVPPDHFGPILAENDPERNRGVLVGDCWEDRLECRQWGAHLPHVSGICGQSKYGAQSVVLSGGYQDDEDHGEWFLYTGSGGRDLSGNKRTNKEQSFDQKFEKSNESLRVSCIKGYPVRVVRSYKEKRSSYAPEEGVRYDGIYRIEKCWFKVGKQGFKVCRYLFVRCDNSPAPWTSDLHGDKVRALPIIPELKKATNIIERMESPSWDYDVEEGIWKWKKPPPPSKKGTTKSCPQDGKQERKTIIKKKAQDTSLERLLEGFACSICRKVMNLPLTTPCGHNFCKACLEGAFAGQALVRERTCVGGRTLRSQKNVMKCPTCTTDISEFLANPQVNRELMDVIERLQSKTKEGGDNVEGTEKEFSDSVEEKPDSSAGSEDEEACDSMEEIPDSSFGSGENDLPNPQAEDKRKREEKEKASLPTEETPDRMSQRKKIDAEDSLSKIDDAGKEKQ